MADGLKFEITNDTTDDVSIFEKLVAHGLGNSCKNIRDIKVIIRGDNEYHILTRGNNTVNSTQQGFVRLIDNTNITLFRLTNGTFDSAVYDSTSYNRGWITIWYEA